VRPKVLFRHAQAMLGFHHMLGQVDCTRAQPALGS
jgi:hypothetical protein